MKNPQFTIAFDGAFNNGDCYSFPSDASPYAGFANSNQEIYPLQFTNVGKITFDYDNTANIQDVIIRFRIERLFYMDPAYTVTFTCPAGESGNNEIEIPSQGENTFRSIILYLDTKDLEIKLSNFEVIDDPIPEPDPITFSGFTWNYVTTPGNESWPENNEKQGYDAEHAIIKDDILEISLTKELGSNDQIIYKSSRLICVSDDNNPILKLEKGKKLSVEFNAKMPKSFDSDGKELENVPLWPALWMMGSGHWNDPENQQWPYCGEIDVLEWSSSVSRGVNKYSTAIHWNEGTSYNPFFISYTYDANMNLTDNYHNYKTTISHLNNDLGLIEMFFDGKKVSSYYLNRVQLNELYKTVNKSGEVIDNNKQYGMIMNLALAGNYTGFEGNLNDFINDFPNFDNATLFIKSVDVSCEKIPEPKSKKIPIINGYFGGAITNGKSYLFPSDAESFAGFFNTNLTIYPLKFTKKGKITFDYENKNNVDVIIRFRIEKFSFPEVDPAYNTVTFTCPACKKGKGEIIIPSQGVNEFNSLIFYLDTRDTTIKITNFEVFDDISPEPECKSLLLGLGILALLYGFLDNTKKV